jgi:hypothetical protein
VPDDQQTPAAESDAGDPGREFAELMSSAAAAAAPAGAEPWLNPDGSHKYGTHPDGSPKKAKGRPRKSPSLDELKAAKAAQDTAAETPSQAPDRAPAAGKRKTAAGDGKTPGDPVPQHRPGVITRGMNKRYRQLGKMLRPLDHDIGQALVEMARNDADPPEDGQEPEDNSVGACWDDVARVNPRIRRFCLAVIQGGAYGALVMAHTPLGIAVALKFVSANPGFIGRLILSLAEPDEDTPPGEGGLPFGMTAEDMQEMLRMADKIIPSEVLRDAAAAGAQNGRPPGPFPHHGQGARRQPKATTRAARKAS